MNIISRILLQASFLVTLSLIAVAAGPEKPLVGKTPSATEPGDPGVIIGLKPSTAPPSGAPGTGKPRLEQMTREQFDRLRDDDEVEFRGTRTRAGDLRAKARQIEAEAKTRHDAGREEAHRKAVDTVKNRQARSHRERKTKLDAGNAKVSADGRRWIQEREQRKKSPEYQAARKEAEQLAAQARTASPAEQAEIEKRAGEILQRLSGPGGGTIAPVGTPPAQGGKQTPVGPNRFRP